MGCKESTFRLHVLVCNHVITRLQNVTKVGDQLCKKSAWSKYAEKRHNRIVIPHLHTVPRTVKTSFPWPLTLSWQLGKLSGCELIFHAEMFKGKSGEFFQVNVCKF